jgi:hypothetical protein
MKFGVGVRVEGKSGAIQGLQGLISSRLKVGSQNLLLIRWDNGQESQVGTGAVSILGAIAPNQQVDQEIPVNPDLHNEEEDPNIDEDELFEGSESEEDIFEEDFGDQYG